jgi:hypothetical protein
MATVKIVAGQDYCASHGWSRLLSKVGYYLFMTGLLVRLVQGKVLLVQVKATVQVMGVCQWQVVSKDYSPKARLLPESRLLSKS